KPTPELSLATQCCWRLPAQASINSKITSIAGGFLKKWSGNWSPKTDGAETQAGLDTVHHHCGDGVLRRGNAVLRVFHHGAAQVRFLLSFLRAPDCLDGSGFTRAAI